MTIVEKEYKDEDVNKKINKCDLGNVRSTKPDVHVSVMLTGSPNYA